MKTAINSNQWLTINAKGTKNYESDGHICGGADFTVNSYLSTDLVDLCVTWEWDLAA